MTRLSDIPFPPNLMFLHPVGISTFKYGVAIPVEAQKAVRELPFLGFLFEMPIVVAGVGVSGAVVPRNKGKYFTSEATE